MTEDNQSNRVEAYVQSIEDNHGLLNSSTARSSIKAELNEHDRDYEDEAPQTVKNQDWEIFSYESENHGTVYVAENWSRVAIDDVLCTSYTFDHYPSENDISSIDSARTLQKKVKTGQLPREFDCWECGHHTHILDIGTAKASDEQRLDSVLRFAEDRYCNKC